MVEPVIRPGRHGSMSGATFVRVRADDPDFEVDFERTVGEMLRGWLDRIPGRRNLTFRLSSFEQCDWVRIDGTVDDDTAAAIASRLATRVLRVSALLEFHPHFDLLLLEPDRIVRRLTQEDQRRRSPWTCVVGDEQPWERDVFFAPGDAALCVRTARSAEQLREWKNISTHRSLLPGAQFPFAANPTVLDRLRAALGLPWFDGDRRTKRTTIIRSSNPDPPRPWWKLW